jgi:hypothetical protein
MLKPDWRYPMIAALTVVLTLAGPSPVGPEDAYDAFFASLSQHEEQPANSLVVDEMSEVAGGCYHTSATSFLCVQLVPTDFVGDPAVVLIGTAEYNDDGTWTISETFAFQRLDGVGFPEIVLEN